MAFGDPCNVTGSVPYGPCPAPNERCSPVSGTIGVCQPANLPDPGSPNYPYPGPGSIPPNLVCNGGYSPEWNPTTMQWFCPTGPAAPPASDDGCPPGQHRGGGHPGNPCRPDQPGTPGTPTDPTTTTSQVPRFYAPDFFSYLFSGQLGAGVPQPQGDLLSLLSGSLFNQSAGLFGISPLQQWQMNSQDFGPLGRPDAIGARQRAVRRLGPEPDTRDVSVLGLPGGGAALGYIDPAWRFDTRTTTTGGSPSAPAPPAPGGGGNPCGGDTGGCPPGQHRGGCHPGNPCRPDSAPAPSPAPAPGTPAPSPAPAPAPGGGGNPCGSTQGCPPGQHRGGCHPGNPCKPDYTFTSSLLGSATKQPQSFGNATSLLNPGSFSAGIGKPGLFTSQILGGR